MYTYEKYNYAFDDLIASGFYYDNISNKIEIYFDDFTDIDLGIIEESKCKLVLEDWEEGNSRDVRLCPNFETLHKHLGIIAQIYSFTWREEYLVIYHRTINGLFVEILLKNPKVSLIIL